MMRGWLPLALLAANLAAAAPAAAGIRGLEFVLRDLLIAKRNLQLTSRALYHSSPGLALVSRHLVFRTEDLVRVVETEKNITIEIPSGVLFDPYSTEFQPSAAFALKEAVSILRAKTPGEVRVEGYAEAEITAADGQRLSSGRAQSVERWLVNEPGLTKLKFASSRAAAANPATSAARQPGQPRPGHLTIVFAKE
jgi:outer membrane protein OmpA-like peptidoglycan-associated protein